MPFVVDASVTACWLLPDESHLIAAAARERLLRDHALVPRIWWFEIRNILIVNERRVGSMRARAIARCAFSRGSPLSSINGPTKKDCLALRAPPAEYL